MRLTRGVDYGARGAIYLAMQPPGTIALISEIARQERVPESYLAKIFQNLSREGIVQSYRGARGGFSLARPPAEITLYQIIQAIDGPLALCPCLCESEGCDRIDTCGLYPFICEAQEQVTSVLANTTLEAIAAREKSLLAGLSG